MPALTLVNIVLKWIQEDPLLKEHITYTPDDPGGEGDGVYLGCCTPHNHVPYAVAHINNKFSIAQTWEWAPWDPSETFRPPGTRVNFTNLSPGDPQFFEKLKTGLIAAHNSLTKPQHYCSI